MTRVKTEKLQEEARWLSEMTNRIVKLGSTPIHLSDEAVAELVRDLRKRGIKCQNY